jgi:hypothetical protein
MEEEEMIKHILKAREMLDKQSVPKNNRESI